jgi:WD40 repeat protein
LGEVVRQPNFDVEPFGEIKVWQVPSGKEQTVFRDSLGWVTALAWSATEAELALIDQKEFQGNAEVKLLDLAKGKTQTLFTRKTHELNAVAFTPDGRLLIAGTLEGSVKVWEWPRATKP